MNLVARTARATAPIFAIAALLLVSGSLPLHAGTGADTPRMLTVTGQGEVRGAPDEAQVSAGVVSVARTAAAALADNSRAMNAVFDTLKHAGIADKDMQTSDFSVDPQYATDKNGNYTQDITGYRVSNTVTVRVRNLSKLGETLDALVSSGANSLGSIAFTISNPKPLMNEARADAVADAISRAQTLAKAAGVTLGPITSIGEQSYEPPRPVYRMAAMAEAAPPPPTPIAAGEESVTASVSITWAMR